MTGHEVTCIQKSDRYDPQDRILGIGGVNADGTRWYATQEQLIAWIESGQFEFYVRVEGREVRVIVAVSRYGNKYVKTQADGEQPNNLLSLPEARNG
jgi:hypothetical protein